MSPISYGVVEESALTAEGSTNEITKYHKGVAVRHVRRINQSVFADNKKVVLAHFLRLADKLDSPHITDISFSCHIKPNTGKYELEVGWQEQIPL